MMADTVEPGGKQGVDTLIHDEMAPGFLGLLLGQIVDRLVEEGGPSAERAGIRAPLRAFSFISLLSRADLTVTEIAPRLGVTHAGVIKTEKTLEKLGFVERGQNPDDARRKPLRLTDAGREEAERIAVYMDRACAVYREMFAETGMDLFAAARAFEEALDRKGFDARMGDG
ncbi:MarR family winged helix-turn-helix transcriptional regulator [Maricaulis parjimensis]|uniref:MarR family winged helix-turn-helix transcriptional regulator n=1 Tax=Maricaulis parjimensis TaxID=144023 RepID=UPI001939EE85|nr:MarR family transcriptional regulator [Maricaulis parjimensis]